LPVTPFWRSAGAEVGLTFVADADKEILIAIGLQGAKGGEGDALLHFGQGEAGVFSVGDTAGELLDVVSLAGHDGAVGTGPGLLL
jgi:hypothetical protein